MAEPKGSLTMGLTASINQTFKFGRILVVSVTFVVCTAIVLFLTWVSARPSLQKPALRFLVYLIAMAGTMTAFYLMLSAMVAAAKMAALDTADKGVSFIGGFVIMVTHFVKVVFATIVPVGLLVVSVGVLWGMGLLGVIPKFGPVFWGIFSFIPIIVSIFAAFVLVKLYLTIFLVPGIIATSEEGGYACYKKAAHIIKTRLLKLLAWFIVAFILVVLFYTVIDEGIDILGYHTGRTMATKNLGVIGAGKMPDVTFTDTLRVGGRSLIPSIRVRPSGASGGDIIAGGWFFGLEFAVILAILCSCGFIFFAIAGMHAYAVLSKEPEVPISLSIPVDISNLGERAAKLRESVSEKVKAEMAETKEEK